MSVIIVEMPDVIVRAQVVKGVRVQKVLLVSLSLAIKERHVMCVRRVSTNKWNLKNRKSGS